MREEVTAIRWLVLGSLSASLPMCNNLIQDGDFEDVEGEREVLRSIFLGSLMAAVFSLPLNLTEDEQRFITEGIEEDAKFDVDLNGGQSSRIHIFLDLPSFS